MARVGIWLAVTLVVLGAAGIRLRLLDVPLDRDEGEYAYFGQLLLEGVPPYAAAYNLKAPGIYGVYALILAVFGQTPAGIHLGLIVVTSATAILMFLLVRRLVGPGAGLVATAVYAVQALNPKTLALAAYAEHFVLLFVVAGCLVLEARRPIHRPLLVLAAGLLFGLGFLMKQSAGAFVAGGALYVLLSSPDGQVVPWPRRLPATAVFLGGAVAPFVIVCLALWLAGTLRTFVFWAFIYGSTYSAELSAGLINLAGRFLAVAPSSSVTLALAAVGFAVLLRDRLYPRRLFVLLLTAASGVGTAAGLHFRPQYCLLMLPGVAVLTAIGLQALVRLVAAQPAMLRSTVAVAVVVAAVGQPLHASRAALFELDPSAVSRFIYGSNPFLESVHIARYIRERTAPGDRIAVIGSEPQIYFYAGRRSATGYIYTYPLMEPQPYAIVMQRHMILEIERADPRYLIYVHAPSSWLLRESSDHTIFRWLEQYQRRFKRVGVVDIRSQRETVYRWDGDALGYAPRSDTWLMVFERGGTP